MTELVQSFSSSGWLQLVSLVIALLALLISIISLRRVFLLSRSRSQKPESPDLIEEDFIDPVIEQYKNNEVSLELTAKRNARDQLRLILENTGVVTARNIEFVIGEPIRVINEEELVNGITDNIEFTESAIKPRLTVIDSETNFPISEVLPGVLIDIIAVTTMGYGKICDFPISVSWVDDRGTNHFLDEVLTI